MAAVGKLLNRSRLLGYYKKFQGAISLAPAYIACRNYSSPSSQICTTPIAEFEGKPGINTYQDLYKFSLSEPDEFWGTLARSRLQWMQDFDQVTDSDMNQGRISWFRNGKLNVSGKYKPN
ncbi:MAG: hypothetical protein JJV94_04120 [Sulfurospirillum sp.]|nr:hypothetical protein [Sulfurospirillum sp.]